MRANWTTVRNGFTLIELLVVVLIIGILAAVAVPQYQKAVYKAKTTEALSMLKAIMQAQEVYYLANGEYTGDISKLEVEVPFEIIDTWGAGGLFDDKYSYSCHPKIGCHASANNPNMPTIEIQAPQVQSSKIYCFTYNGSKDKNDVAKSICKSMGVLDTSNSADWFAGKFYIIN